MITCIIIGLPACKGDDPKPDKKITTVVSGKITGPDGAAIADAEVSAESQKTKTKTDGTYELSISHSGSFTLAVTKKGYLPSEASALEVKTTAKTHTKNIKLNYAYTKKVNGTVKNVAGTPIKGVKVSACLSPGNCVAEATTKADGYYELSVKHAGSFTLTATSSGYKGEAAVTTDGDTHQSDLAKDIELNFDYKTFFNGALKGRSLESFIHEADPAARVALNGTSSKKINIALYASGGPLFAPVNHGLSLEDFSDKLAPNANYARVIVLQEQMIRRANNTLNVNKVATAKEAQEINQYSAAILYALAAEFVQRGHKVSLFTHSFGSFIAPEMLRQHGDAPFRKILISAGRLDIDEKIHTSFFKGIRTYFEFDNARVPNFTIKLQPANYKDQVEKKIKEAGFCSSDDFRVEELCVNGEVNRAKATRHINTRMTGMRLQSDLGKNRYTKLLENKFAKVIYYFGGKDAAVGRLTVEEVKALTGKSTGYQPDKSRDETIDNFESEDPNTGELVKISKTLKVHTIKGITGRATVKYAMEDDHAVSFLVTDIRNDMIASFANE